MSITENKNAFVTPTSGPIGLSQMFAVTAGTSNPAYLVLSVLDRSEYTVGSAGTTGTLSGNGNTLRLSSIGGDGWGTGIVFAYQPASGRYYNSTYGYFDQLTYNASSSPDDLTNLSLFGTNILTQATSHATNAYSMMQTDPSGYLGSASVVTQPKFNGPVPAQATPASLAAVADGFVGQVWNMNGCWILASTIAAEAGVSLPVQTTAIGVPGQANGEWMVAFNGPSGQSGNWQSLVKEGEVIVIGTPGGGGHVTTCVSGSGGTAMLVDNATYVTASGQVQNLAKDGSASDILIASPHAASQEWAGVAAASVVIYELDTPVVADAVATCSLKFSATQSLGSLFTVADPANKLIVQWQAYDTASGDQLVLNGVDYNDHTAAAALSASSLASVSLLAGSAATIDTVEVRASNGTYWGDWTALNVAVMASAPLPPVLAAQTAHQTWMDGKPVVLTVGFSDPQGGALTYAALQSNGQALPAWLVFNAATDTFTGTPPAAAQTLNIVVTATDTRGLSASDAFSATVIGAPTLLIQTPEQHWTESEAISLTIPANGFTDPQGQPLVYSASQDLGQPLPSWLSFNAATLTLSGTAPTSEQSLTIQIKATDSSGLVTSDNFIAIVQAPPLAAVPPKPRIVVANPTPTQTWSDGQAPNFVLPSSTFTDSLGLKMTFAAYEVSGPNETSWLRFNPTTETFSGTVPLNTKTSFGLEVIASDAQKLSAADFFNVTLAPATTHNVALPTGLSWIGAQTPSATLLGMLALHG